MKRQNRLSRSRDFDAVYRQGRSVATRYLVLYAFPRSREDGSPPRLGLAVPRQVGSAVDRNGVKRRLREVFAELGTDARSGKDYVLIARPGLVETAEARGYAWLVEQVRNVFEQAGALEDTAA